MRYIPTEHVKAGMILGKTVYGSGSELLLIEKSIIKEDYIKRLRRIGIQGLYIQDDFSSEIKIEEVVTPELKSKAVSFIKGMFLDESDDFKKNLKSSIDLLYLMTELVDQIFENKDVQVNVIDLKNYDEYTYLHSINVAVLSVVTGLALGLSKEELILLGIAGILHDVGKRFISTELLNKEEELTKEDWKQIKEHSKDGYHYIRENFNLPIKSYIGILDHHERYDGNGYPNKKEGQKISLFGRILAVADVYDALVSNRPYHKAILPSDAWEYLLGASGSQFDPQVVEAFSKKVAIYPLGTQVNLSNKLSGIVVKNYLGYSLRPKIKIFSDSDVPVYIDLKNDVDTRNITIVGFSHNSPVDFIMRKVV